MIVPAFIMEMQRAGLGTVDKDLFWEELPQSPSAEGIWVVTRGDAGSDESQQTISLDIFLGSKGVWAISSSGKS